MAASISVLISFTALTLALAMTYVLYRVALVLSFKAKANSWTRNAQQWQNPVWVTRFEHMHANALENLPVYAAVVLAASLTNQLGVVDPLAWIYFAFRIGQVVVHAISTSPLFVFLRANMLLGQWVCLVYWILAIAGLI